MLPPLRHAVSTMLALLLLLQAAQLPLKRLTFELQRDTLAQTSCRNRFIPAAALDCRASCVWDDETAGLRASEDPRTQSRSERFVETPLVYDLPHTRVALLAPGDLSLRRASHFHYPDWHSHEALGRALRPPITV